MPAPVNKQAGFSLTEVLLSMVLMVMVVTALGGYHRALASGFASASQWRQLWRCAWQQAQPTPPPLPPGWRVQRLQTTAEGCVSIQVTVISPGGRQGQMTRLFCPLSQ
ncbi:prepilin peptidase dependent protein C [Kosakonia oryzendophytica]|uniref:Prepilin peptidase dependent protein C n=1 Tax=Kosakonia oryzendophytica TaxID=1005665 RepID=A0A1C4CPK1_9ENTR|nr:prepilin-type N-terminal cleavage/methylation domain-containing protein [Kosakonia oryzendophytica]AMO47364.1 Prepilin peptidase dependent protein C [Enterobacter sp. FY-07]TDT56945.1 prepilin peptidase dependent protein C [Enterobacter sp. AG5470]WBT59092.1 prepilin-type N-terminal cleavage/methylation domain-containing protein [Kosakonia oryzendophytica]SCC20980.1 prepilin peptidase dependent protein C [Kosakonia oryzendophytica]